MKKITLKKYFLALFLLPLAATLFVACNDDDDDIVTLMVASEKADCGTAYGYGYNCLYVKGDVYKQWIIMPPYYISNFEYEEGYEYELKVRRQPYSSDLTQFYSNGNESAIPPEYVYILIEIVSKVEKKSDFTVKY